jgi:Zn-dependent protease
LAVPPLSPVEILVRFAALVLSLSFHEAAHAWTANRLGDPTAKMLGRLTLNPIAHVDWIGTVLFPLVAMISNLPLIGWAKPVPVNSLNLREPRRDFAIVALAGPVSNIILAVGAAVLRLVVGMIAPPDQLTTELLMFALAYFIGLNVLLAVFNMIPVPPLDGGNVLLGVLPGEAARVYQRIRPFGFLILYGLMLSGVLWDIIGPINRVVLGWLT